MRKVLSVWLSDKITAELDAFAKATGRNKSDIVKESLGVFLWETRFKEIRKRLVKRTKTAKIITEDDIFRTVS